MDILSTVVQQTLHIGLLCYTTIESKNTCTIQSYAIFYVTFTLFSLFDVRFALSVRCTPYSEACQSKNFPVLVN